MTLLEGVLYPTVILAHIISVMIAVGSVTVLDYFHLVGLRKRKLGLKLLYSYPLLSKLIIFALIATVFTGTLLLINHPELLSLPLFRLKVALIGIIILNAVALHKAVYPAMTKCIQEETWKYCTPKVLGISAVTGGISVTTWYAVLILSFTKEYGYSVMSFVTVYLVALASVILVARYAEEHRQKR